MRAARLNPTGTVNIFTQNCSIVVERRFFSMPTSKKTASQAGKDLRDPKTPKKDRGPIASDLAQAKKKK
jgi:hypothetical protein